MCDSSTAGIGKDGEREGEPQFCPCKLVVYDVKYDLDCRKLGSLVAGGPFGGLFFHPVGIEAGRSIIKMMDCGQFGKSATTGIPEGGLGRGKIA